MEWKCEGGKLQRVFLLGRGKPNSSAGVCEFPCWQNLGDVRGGDKMFSVLSSHRMFPFWLRWFLDVWGQLWGVIPPLSGPATAWIVNWVFWDNTPLLSSVSGTDTNLSLGSTHVTALKETGKVSKGCQRSLYALVLCLFALWAFFYCIPSIISEAFNSWKQFNHFSNLKKFGLDCLILWLPCRFLNDLPAKNSEVSFWACKEVLQSIFI